jgi:hypothetical protein
MKIFTSIPSKPTFERIFFPLKKSESVSLATSSVPMRPVEIRRYLRELRENRQYNFTKDFLY